MTFNSRLLASAALCFTIALAPTVSVHAGQLFPPGNTIDGDSKQSCPTGSVLTWNGAEGTVECGPIATATSCSSGEVMIGVHNGVAVCKPYDLSVSCPSGAVLTGIQNGAPICAQEAATSTPVPAPPSCTVWGVQWLEGNGYVTGNLHQQPDGTFMETGNAPWITPSNFTTYYPPPYFQRASNYQIPSGGVDSSDYSGTEYLCTSGIWVQVGG